MKANLLITAGLFLIASELSAQNYFLNEKEGDASCISYYVTDEKDNLVKLPDNIQKNLDCPSVIDLKGSVLIMYADNNLLWYDIVTQQTSTLVKLYPDIDGVSNPAWSPDGKHLMFVIINQQKTHGYKQWGRVVILGVDGAGKVTSKKKMDVSINFTCGSVCTSTPEDDFGFTSNTEYRLRRHFSLDHNAGDWEYFNLK